ncbi:MAG TPA: hypothetical protein PK668_24735 [Myxococcota bacterium]|nr:hypothetical protein [Myxococcota bacterium]HRY96853.1 hypothetical protein [Myxococcota bacterium]HSA22546.1 hypothetical protein [Myxococcota bacterium]
MQTHARIAAWLFLGLPLAGCGEADLGRQGLEVRFAATTQALGEPDGLPVEVRSLQLEAYRQGVRVGTSGCLDAADHQLGAALDVAPGAGLRLEVSGWGAEGCAGQATWFGLTDGLEVIEGEAIDADVYVLRRGWRLNPARGALPGGRAFATATPLPDGRVLLAGGFDQLTEEAPGRVRLGAACDGLVYDPSSARVVRVLPLGACRGLHQALQLSDGSVWLLGGTSEASLDLSGSLRPVLRASEAGRTGLVERYDPVSGTVESVGSFAPLARADTAAAVQNLDRMVVLGGRTQELRSSDLITGGPDGAWYLFAGRLLSPRAGARAASLQDGAVDYTLVVGGNLGGDEDAERVAFGSMSVEPVPFLDPQPELTLVGHGLDAAPDGGFLVSGGMRPTPGARPRNELWVASPGNGGYLAEARALAVPRAHHLTAWASPRDGQPALVVAGGLNYSLAGAREIELCSAEGVCELAADLLGGGPVGLAGAPTPDGALLLAGGLAVSADGELGLSDRLELLAP